MIVSFATTSSRASRYGILRATVLIAYSTGRYYDAKGDVAHSTSKQYSLHAEARLDLVSTSGQPSRALDKELLGCRNS